MCRGDSRYRNSLKGVARIFVAFPCMTAIRIWILSAVWASFFLPNVSGQTMHTPAGIEKAIQASGLKYVKAKAEISRYKIVQPQNSPYTWVEAGQNGIVPVLRNPTGKCWEKIKMGLDLLEEGRLEKALRAFERAVPHCEEPAWAYTEMVIAMIQFNHLDSLKWVSQQLLAENYYNYVGHLGLAVAYQEAGQFENAIKEMTIAWLMNAQMDGLFEGLPALYRDAGWGWEDFEFDPPVGLEKQNDTIRWSCPDIWDPYAKVWAVWQFDKGYRAQMMAEAKAAGISSAMLEYKEAILNQMLALELPQNQPYLAMPEFHAMAKAVKGGKVHDFIFVELLLEKNSAIIFQQTPETIQALADYVIWIHRK